MSHLGARLLRVLNEDSPYELRDIEGNPISKDEARRLVLSKYHVSEDIRRERRRRNRKVGKERETATCRTNEAAKLLNLYKSKPSPENKSNSEPQGGQMNDP